MSELTKNVEVAIRTTVNEVIEEVWIVNTDTFKSKHGISIANAPASLVRIHCEEEGFSTGNYKSTNLIAHEVSHCETYEDKFKFLGDKAQSASGSPHKL